jgi:type II secretory ATPase GspE/PulE/Tfp pilus assembly ATPase PilB-like protein
MAAPKGRLVSQNSSVSSDTRRTVLAPLFRLLVQRREPSPDSIRNVLQLTTERLCGRLNAVGAFLLLVDPTIKEAEVVAAALSPPVGDESRESGRRARDRRERRAEKLVGARLRTTQMGLLAGVREAFVRSDVPEDERPLALEHATRVPAELVACVPKSVSQRLNGLLVLVGRTNGRVYSASELAFLVDVAGHVVRGLQRSLGLGSPLTDEEKGRAMAVLADVAYWETPKDFTPDSELLAEIGPRVLSRAGILPLERLPSGHLKVALANPLDRQAIEDFELACKTRAAERLASTPTIVRGFLRQVYPELEEVGSDEGASLQGDVVAQLAHGLRDLEEDTAFDYRFEEVNETSSPIVRLSCRIIEDAYFRGASDVHVETTEHRVVIRHRIDGVCRERVILPVAASRPLVARFKIMSDLDVAEHRLPQDGRIEYRRFNGELPIDLRVSILPMLQGEWVCMRILEKKRSTLPLEELGFSEHNLERYRQAIRTPYGLILHCGPTGAGKSMTLYAALNEINDPRVKILTAEDPIEYVLRGIGQMQVKRGIGLTFAAALRSFLRHDPDVILVGEIRDEETARISVDASLTGHLLLSTLHTNDAPSSVARLVKLGVEPFLVANTLLALCAQRLVRKLCHCRRLAEPTTQERAYLKRALDDAPLTQLGKAVGCEHCNHLGYRGRTGVHEVLTLNSRMRQQISEGANPDTIKRCARDLGMRTLFEDCLEKVKSQETTLEEAFRVAQPDEVL